MKKRIIALILTLTAVLCLFTACGKEKTPSTDGTAFFSAFESETLDGRKITEEIFKGNKITMVNVWGIFCPYCIQEMPDLQKISENYKDKGVTVIGVLVDTFDSSTETNVPEKIEEGKTIVEMTGAAYDHILLSPSFNKTNISNAVYLPTTYFLNEKGEIIGTEYVGAKSYSEWSQIIDSLLGEQVN